MRMGAACLEYSHECPSDDALPPGTRVVGRHELPASIGKLRVHARLLGGWSAHTLRHYFATVTYQATGDLYATQRLLGRRVASDDAGLRRWNPRPAYATRRQRRRGSSDVHASQFRPWFLAAALRHSLRGRTALRQRAPHFLFIARFPEPCQDIWSPHSPGSHSRHGPAFRRPAVICPRHGVLTMAEDSMATTDVVAVPVLCSVLMHIGGR